jgi:hypothetical protein
MYVLLRALRAASHYGRGVERTLDKLPLILAERTKKKSIEICIL